MRVGQKVAPGRDVFVPGGRPDTQCFRSGMDRAPPAGVDGKHLPIVHMVRGVPKRLYRLVGARPERHQVQAARPQSGIGHILARHGADAATRICAAGRDGGR